jgi:tRNA A37 threonylcarbamoyladenosine synthetase subunit TsaC/SUA5/YrdC
MSKNGPETKLAAQTIERDAKRVFDVLAGGGTAIIYLDVAYAILGRSQESVRRIYAAKRRSFARPTGIVGGLELHDEIHLMDERKKALVRAVTVEHDLPLSVVAPFRREHPFLRNLDPFVLDNANKDGTINLLLNAGLLRTRISRLSYDAMTPLVGSSANVSLTGSKYRVEDIEPEMLAAADIVIDYGVSLYHNAHGRSSTIIDFRDLSVVREGVCFEQIGDVLRTEFDVELRAKAASVR